jgi:hypothetical protein
MGFHVGQKVERIGGVSTHPGAPPFKTPLTVCWVGVVHWRGQTYEGIDLSEFPSATAGYCALYFRPVVERKTDISVFTKILERESVDAY